MRGHLLCQPAEEKRQEDQERADVEKVELGLGDNVGEV